MSTQPVYVAPYRAMSSFTADAVLEESHEDQLVTTEHPVETGSTISDHAYKLPAEVTLTYGWSLGSKQNTQKDQSYLKTLYTQLLALQTNRTLFSIYTGKRMYSNMLLVGLSVETNNETENSLIIRAACREILLASTSTVTIPNAANMTTPQSNAPTLTLGYSSVVPATNYNSNLDSTGEGS